MKDWILFVEDIFHACVDIESYVKDLTYESFLDDKRTRDATVIIYSLSVSQSNISLLIF
ncbi:hypothetical protein [Methanospirillum hungatei]|uniref:hypothetical protein n=1 Tax=Methanospirillum hungatei TaxID=2203 RepID=UPI0003264C2C|nr:hypothetical protein [Methanospirillum hungatei]